jgi:hypothetical protein
MHGASADPKRSERKDGVAKSKLTQYVCALLFFKTESDRLFSFGLLVESRIAG